jgi:SM-20-related protein
MSKELFELNPDLDASALSEQFAQNKRVQIRDILTTETASEIRSILAQQTPWGIATQAGLSTTPGPQAINAQELQTGPGRRKFQTDGAAAQNAAALGDYAFIYGRYSLVEAFLGKWDEGGPHDLLLEYLNTQKFLQFISKVTGIEGLIKADGHATLFGQNNFLGLHSDLQVDEGWRIAYVLNLAVDDWQPDWGGYLQFFDDEGDIVQGYRPRFNTLNLFQVPQPHAVSYVAPFAPVGRYAISGWFRDR